MSDLSTPTPEPVTWCNSSEQPDLPPRVGHILRLADIIREVDSTNKPRATRLAEAILSHRDFPSCCPVPAPAPTPDPIAWCNSSDLRDAAVRRQSFSGWREQYPDADVPLYAGPIPHPACPFAPVHASERPWERNGWLDDQGRSWFYDDIEEAWILQKFLSIDPDGHEIRTSCFPWHLPAGAIPIPAPTEEEHQS